MVRDDDGHGRNNRHHDDGDDNDGGSDNDDVHAHGRFRDHDRSIHFHVDDDGGDRYKILDRGS